jgi:hypothetical protein
MNLTSEDVGTMMEWVKGTLYSRAHALPFTFYSGPLDDFTHKYVGKLQFEEGRVVDGPRPVPIGSPRGTPHSTSSQLVGVGKEADGSQIKVTIGADTLHHQPIVVVKGDVNLDPSRGPFERQSGSENQFNFTFSQHGTNYGFEITMEGADLKTYKDHHLP